MFGANNKPSGSTTAFGGEPEEPVVPIETIQNESRSIDERRNLFYRYLDKGQILIFKVINDTLPEYFKLLVMYKETDSPTKLDDLSVIMFLPRAELENLRSNDLIRAAVSSARLEERKIFVTVNPAFLGENPDTETLGKISEEDLPFFLDIPADCMKP